VGYHHFVTETGNLTTDRVKEHFITFWGGHSLVEERPDHGPMLETLPGFRVLKFAPSSHRPYWIYVTLGTHAIDSGHQRLEFFLLAPQESYTHVMTLTMLAYFHADPDHRLGLGHTVNIGEPWVEERSGCRSASVEARVRSGGSGEPHSSGCDHLLISLPYTFGPKLEWLQLPEYCVRILWALPITAAEARFAIEKGVEALEQRFEAAGLDCLDPARNSVV